MTDAAGPVTGTDVTFRAGGRFHTDFTVVTPTATGANPGVTPTATGVDAIQIGTPECGAVAPVKILSATPSESPSASPSVTVTPTESPSVTVTPTESPSVTGTPQVVPGGSVHVQHER